MDKKIKGAREEDIRCYRLRTARQKKRMQYKDFDKRLLQLAREEDELYLQKWSLGWETLSPPVQQGWKRFFVLREDVARSSQAAFYNGILDKINTTAKSHKKTFLVRRRKYGKKYYVVKGQNLREPNYQEFEKLRFTETEKKCFDEVWRLNGCRQLVKHFVFKEPWRFVLQIRPNMITRVRAKDAVLEARIRTIQNLMNRNDWRKRQRKLLSGDYKKSSWRAEWDEKANEKYAYRNWPLVRILDAMKGEQ